MFARPVPHHVQRAVPYDRIDPAPRRADRTVELARIAPDLREPFLYGVLREVAPVQDPLRHTQEPRSFDLEERAECVGVPTGAGLDGLRVIQHPYPLVLARARAPDYGS